MNPGQSNDSRESRWDESDELWRLLGKTPEADPGAWFTAQTLARCRQEASEATGFAAMKSQLKHLWRWALAGGVAVSMAVALMTPHASPVEPPDQHSVQEAFAVVASLDYSDSDSSTPSWQDQSL